MSDSLLDVWNIRKCNNCKANLNISEFYYRKDRKKYLNKCIKCINIQHEEYYKNNKKERKKYAENYTTTHKNEISKNKKDYYQKHKSERKEYEKYRIENDLNYKIARNLRIRMSMIIRNNSVGSAVNDVGCSIEELIMHLESKFYANLATGEMMNWSNYGYYGWHIDHIIPLSSFDLTVREQFLKAAHYANLQPLWAQDNFAKSNKI
jgi:hypothetical protein